MQDDIWIRSTIEEDLKKIFCDIINHVEEYKGEKFNNFTYRTLYWRDVFGEIFKKKKFSFHPKIFLEKFKNRLKIIEKKFSPEVMDEIYLKWSDPFFKYYYNYTVCQNCDDPELNRIAFFNHMIYVLNSNRYHQQHNECTFYKTCIDMFIKFYTKWFFFNNIENGFSLIESVILYNELCEYRYGTVLENCSGEVVSVLAGDHYTENLFGEDYVVLRVLLDNQLLVDVYVNKLKNILYKKIKEKIAIGEKIFSGKLMLNEKKIYRDYHLPCPVYTVRSWENIITNFS